MGKIKMKLRVCETEEAHGVQCAVGRTVVGFAVNLDGLTSTAVFGTVHGTLALFPEASAGCFFRTFCTVTHDVDFPSGTKHIFVVSTGCCGTF